jgi:hypothetical protein
MAEIGRGWGQVGAEAKRWGVRHPGSCLLSCVPLCRSVCTLLHARAKCQSSTPACIIAATVYCTAAIQYHCSPFAES